MRPEPYLYITVGNKTGEKEAAALLEALNAGYMIASATGAQNFVHYVLFMPDYGFETDADHEIDAEELKIIEDNIDVAMKDIKKRNA